MKKILLVCGISGTGKSTLVKELCKKYPEEYLKLNQFTTRKKRENENKDDYIFLKDEREVNIIKDKYNIFAENISKEGHYGTIDTSKDDMISCVVVNRKGWDSAMKYLVNKYRPEECKIRTLKVEVFDKNLLPKREGRDEEFVRNEEISLFGIEDIIIYRDQNGYDLEEVDNSIKELFMKDESELLQC